jgi:hypothetical protein
MADPRFLRRLKAKTPADSKERGRTAMLGEFQSHAEYLGGMLPLVAEEFKNPAVKALFLDSSIKMAILNLDPAADGFGTMFSGTGRPSNQQAQVARSLVLMAHHKKSPDQFVKYARATPAVQALIGCAGGRVPGASTLRDAMARMRPDPEGFSHFRKAADIPTESWGTDKMFTKADRDKIATLCGMAISGEDFGDTPEEFMNWPVSVAIAPPALEMGLLEAEADVCGDGTCIKSGFNSRGHRKCECGPGSKCGCERHYADPLATCGWDTDLKA